MNFDEYDRPPALGSVVEQDRGTLPFALIHGEALVACASWALGDSGVTPVDHGTAWSGLVDSGEPFVLHDALCPMTPASFLTACVAAAVARETVVVGVRPDPGSEAEREPADGVDRAVGVSIASPVVLPAGVVAALDGLPTLDFDELVAWLRARFPVRFVEAPPAAVRVRSLDELRLLEEQTAPTR